MWSSLISSQLRKSLFFFFSPFTFAPHTQNVPLQPRFSSSGATTLKCSGSPSSKVKLVAQALPPRYGATVIEGVCEYRFKAVAASIVTVMINLFFIVCDFYAKVVFLSKIIGARQYNL